MEDPGHGIQSGENEMSGAPVTIVADSGAGIVVPRIARVTPLGELAVENPASQLFSDTFDSGTLDTINKWVGSSGGTGASPTNAVGSTVLSGGTTANSFSKLTSLLAVKDMVTGNGLGSFKPSEPGFLLFHARINLPFPLPLNSLYYFGGGTSIASPTIASPITQLYGFEVSTAGKMAAVTYQTGTRVLVKDLSVSPDGILPIPQPADANAHKYFIYFRGDVAYWCIDNVDNVVAQFQTGASGPDINTLPLLFQVISNGGTAGTLTLNGVSLGDTAHTGSTQFLFNGVGFEPQRSNLDSNSSLLTLTAQGAGTVNSSDFINTNGKGLKVLVNTTVDAAGTYTISIQGKDIVSGNYYTILTSAAIVGTGQSVLTVYPGVTATANVSASDVLPRTWRIQAVVGTGPITATVGASLIV